MPNKDSKEVKATTTKIAEERLKRLRHQNSKLSLEVRKLKGQLAPIEELKREVLAANQVVKQKLLSLPTRLAPPLAGNSNPAEIEALIREAITDAVNELCYEQSEGA